MATVPKKAIRRRTKAKTAPTRNIGLLLTAPKNVLTPEEIHLTENLAKEIATLASDWRVSAPGPCTITQVKADADSPSLATFRRISLIGGEEMHVSGAYMGSRDGLIFRLTPDTVLLGLNSAEMAITHLEMPIRSSHLLTGIGTELTLMQMLEKELDMKVMPDEMLANIKAKKEAAERERLIKDAEAKSVNYGSNWGAF